MIPENHWYSPIAGKRSYIGVVCKQYEICFDEHQHFTIPALEFRDTPIGVRFLDMPIAAEKLFLAMDGQDGK